MDLTSEGRVQLDRKTLAVYTEVLGSDASTDDELTAAVLDGLAARKVEDWGDKHLRLVDAVKQGRTGGNPPLGGMFYLDEWPPS